MDVDTIARGCLGRIAALAPSLSNDDRQERIVEWARCVADDSLLLRALGDPLVGPRIRRLVSNSDVPMDMRDTLRLVPVEVKRALALASYRDAVVAAGGPSALSGAVMKRPRAWQAEHIEATDQDTQVRLVAADEIQDRLTWLPSDPKRPGHPRRREQHVVDRRRNLAERFDNLEPTEQERLLAGGSAGSLIEAHSEQYPTLGKTQIRQDWTELKRERQGELTALFVALEGGDPLPIARERGRIARRRAKQIPE